MDYIHDNFNVKKWCQPMLQISATIKDEYPIIEDKYNTKNLSLSPVQAYLQSSNLTSQYFYNNANCTTIINYDVNNTREKYNLQDWKAAYALTSLLQPSNEKSFYPEMTEKGFRTNYKKNYDDNWSFSKILKNYIDPRPLSLHFNEIKQYDNNNYAINDFKNLGLFSCHNIVLGQQHYKNYENLIFRSSHLIIDSWKNISYNKTPLGSLSSWSFFTNRKNYLVNNLSILPEIISLVHSRSTVNNVLYPSLCEGIKLFNMKKPIFKHCFSNDEFEDGKNLINSFQEELNIFNNISSAEFIDSDDIMISLNNDEKDLILNSLINEKIAVNVSESIIKKQEGQEFAGISLEVPIEKINSKIVEIILNQLMLTDKRRSNIYLNVNLSDNDSNESNNENDDDNDNYDNSSYDNNNKNNNKCINKNNTNCSYINNTNNHINNENNDNRDVRNRNFFSPSKYFNLIQINQHNKNLNSLFEHSIFESTSSLSLGTIGILRIPEEHSLQYSSFNCDPKAVSLVSQLFHSIFLLIFHIA